jgi:hypothetical protein
MSDETTEIETGETEADTGDRLDKHPRFKAVVREKNDYKRRIAELEEEAARLRPASERVAALESELTSARSRWEEESSLMSQGLLDPEAREVARLLWSRQPEADRKPIAEQIAAWKAEPDAAPVALRGYLAPAVAPSAPASVAAPRVPVGTSPPSPASRPTDAEIERATIALKNSRPGTPDYAAARENLQKLLARTRAV